MGMTFVLNFLEIGKLISNFKIQLINHKNVQGYDHIVYLLPSYFRELKMACPRNNC